MDGQLLSLRDSQPPLDKVKNKVSLHPKRLSSQYRSSSSATQYDRLVAQNTLFSEQIPCTVMITSKLNDNRNT